MQKRAIRYTRPFVYNYQRQILDSPARNTVTEASTKVGKTASHIIWLFEEALKCKRNQSVWWVAPVYAQAEIAFNRMRSQVSSRNFFQANESKLRLTTPWGAHIGFKSAEKPDNLYGDDVYAAVFDEFTRAKEASWHALRSTLTFTKGKCKFIGNVKGKKNWGYKLAQRARSGNDSEWAHFKVTAYDAAAEGLLSYEEIEAAKRDLPELVFNELYLAEAADDGSNPFGVDHIGRCVKPLAPGPAVCFGIDLAKSVDYTVVIGLNATGDVCYFDRFRKDWEQTTAYIRNLPDVAMSIDSTGVGDPIVESIQRSKQYVEAVKFTSLSKQQMMEGLAWAIQNADIGYPAGVIVDELEAFEFFYTASGVRYAAPDGYHDDTVCALALARRAYQQSKHLGVYALI